jgi:hypothetical protein
MPFRPFQLPGAGPSAHANSISGCALEPRHPLPALSSALSTSPSASSGARSVFTAPLGGGTACELQPEPPPDQARRLASGSNGQLEGGFRDLERLPGSISGTRLCACRASARARLRARPRRGSRLRGCLCLPGCSLSARGGPGVGHLRAAGLHLFAGAVGRRRSRLLLQCVLLGLAGSSLRSLVGSEVSRPPLRLLEGVRPQGGRAPGPGRLRGRARADRPVRHTARSAESVPPH